MEKCEISTHHFRVVELGRGEWGKSHYCSDVQTHTCVHFIPTSEEAKDWLNAAVYSGSKKMVKTLLPVSVIHRLELGSLYGLRVASARTLEGNEEHVRALSLKMTHLLDEEYTPRLKEIFGPDGKIILKAGDTPILAAA